MDELEQEFICGVCLEQFEKPVVFPCSHNFCSKCVQDLINHVDQRGTTRFINCPSCRKNVDVTRGVSKLTRNIVLERIIELHMTKLANGNTKLSKPCIKHSDCDLEFYCKTCHKAVCQRCTQESHNGFGHNVKYFSELVLEEKHSISNQLEELDRLVTQLKTKQEILFARENEFKSKTNEIVKQTTKPLRDSVNKCRDYQVQGSGLHEMCSRAIRGQGIPPEQTLQRLNDLKAKLIQFLAFEAKICADSIVPSVDSLKLNMIDLLQPQQSVLTKSDGKNVNSKIQFWNPKALNGTTLEYPDNISLTAMSLESEPAQKKKLPPTQDAATQDRDFSFKAPSFTVGRKW